MGILMACDTWGRVRSRVRINTNEVDVGVGVGGYFLRLHTPFSIVELAR